MASRKEDQEAAGRLEAIRDLAALLAVAWDEPTRRLAEGLSGGTWVSDIRACAADIRLDSTGAAPLHAIHEQYRNSGAGPVLESLRTEHTSLFDIPRRSISSPFESHFVDADSSGKDVPLFISRAATEVGSLYALAGVVAPESEPPDHVARELEFVSFCAHHELDAGTWGSPGSQGSPGSRSSGRDKDDDGGSPRTSGPGTWRELRARMGTEHLSEWIPAMTSEVAEGAETPFYRELARLTAAVIESGVLWSDASGHGFRRRLRLSPV
ncbi:MAG: TorD/DmsD family molecular chaperone [Ancrocorticia sp.]|uniref:TorD/DmsD family molecular chaperone n=1 Tax=Ancrocorticia sp. TaxID=2593684 RepID=UPI003F91DD8E